MTKWLVRDGRHTFPPCPVAQLDPARPTPQQSPRRLTSLPLRDRQDAPLVGKQHALVCRRRVLRLQTVGRAAAEERAVMRVGELHDGAGGRGRRCRGHQQHVPHAHRPVSGSGLCNCRKGGTRRVGAGGCQGHWGKVGRDGCVCGQWIRKTEGERCMGKSVSSKRASIPNESR